MPYSYSHSHSLYSWTSIAERAPRAEDYRPQECSFLYKIDDYTGPTYSACTGIPLTFTLATYGFRVRLTPFGWRCAAFLRRLCSFKSWMKEPSASLYSPASKFQVAPAGGLPAGLGCLAHARRALLWAALAVPLAGLTDARPPGVVKWRAIAAWANSSAVFGCFCARGVEAAFEAGSKGVGVGNVERMPGTRSGSSSSSSPITYERTIVVGTMGISRVQVPARPRAGLPVPGSTWIWRPECRSPTEILK